MRLIDADALKEYFPDNGEGSWTYNVTVKAYIDAQPAIDAVPVIRCKDCKWWNPDKETCIEMDCRAEADGFCAWAERKEE